ncbi:DEAD/DEAH box RNA helicase [Thraustotheca clavata]|uniref:RNA helicase n=1 Tax=Thraustotheca clavata TaxID=74557 RepID=A0A1V9ZQF6_9STRA|nr:DEAD/DEAH box RNA helicase [Thraustotheca clavata]
MESKEMEPTTEMEAISREKERVARIAKLAEEKYAVRQKALEEEAKKPKFLTKKEREEAALARLQQQRAKQSTSTPAAPQQASKYSKFDESSLQRHRELERAKTETKSTSNKRKDAKTNNGPTLTDQEKELAQLKNQYLGKKVEKKKIIKASEKFAKNFQFEWDASDDTSTELNPLYKRREVNLLFGRGYMAGIDLREQRKRSNFITELTRKRQLEQKAADERNGMSAEAVERRQRERERELQRMQEREANREAEQVKRSHTSALHWSDKLLDNMTERDWRIFREDFDIILRGGKAPRPLRKWSEAVLPEPLFQAINELGFERPSPIQMQAIPVGLQRRDIIGIAETGSGKTAAFVIPIIAYLCQLPANMIARTADEGPLALVMAPTRELAMQIEQETMKLAKYTVIGEGNFAHTIKTVSVVGGQSKEEQAFKVREGIDIIIGTPGRLNDVLENRYLVLNQCNYVVLDEADRMIDMGFEQQVIDVLESMGTLLKSENEDELERQLTIDSQFKYRVTMMFSATMPSEVERLAKTFLRHPSIVKIGDETSGKNKRIDQQVWYMNGGKKRQKLLETLRDTLRGKGKKDAGTKIIVFVNVKKECDTIARAVGSEGYRATILHGGKSQDQREESLKGFRDGTYEILVATDVAGRGLDIPDVTHVINYDVPSKIQNYCHRIGRTGRAGKDGVAISFLTEQDEEIMYDLRMYLEACEMPVPKELAHHAMAKAPAGARDEKGNVIAKTKRDTIIYS